MYRNMEQWLEIRKRVLREGISKRQILRETGMHWTTLEKILQHSSPPEYQRNRAPSKPKIGPYLERIRCFKPLLRDDVHILGFSAPTKRKRVNTMQVGASAHAAIGTILASRP